MFAELKNLNLERMDFDQAVAMRAFGKTVISNFADLKVPAPQWLTDNVDSLEAEIKSRRRDALLKRQKEINARLDGLKTADQKRRDLRKEQDEIEALLK